MVRGERKKSTALTSRDLVVQERTAMFCGEKNSTKGVLANVFLGTKKQIQKRSLRALERVK